MKRGAYVRIGAFAVGRVKGVQRRTGWVWVKLSHGQADYGPTALFPRELCEVLA